MTAISDLTHAHTHPRRSAGAHRGGFTLPNPTRQARAGAVVAARWGQRVATTTGRVTWAGAAAAAAFVLAVAAPPARAALADAKTLAGYWPGLAGLACLVRAAAELGPGPGWATAGVALLLVGAVART